MNNYTSIEQSEKLVELGLNLDTADMSYGNFSPRGLGYEDKFKIIATPYITEWQLYENIKKDYNINEYTGYVAWKVIPCWSVGALLELMPFPMLWTEWLTGAFLWRCSATTLEGGKLQEVLGDTPIKAVYTMIVWLLENNYIEKVHKNEE